MDLSEHQVATLLAQFLDVLQNQGKVSVYSKIPSETYTTSRNQKRKNKQEGVHTGVPDYIIVTERKVIFLEIKKDKGSYLRPDQKVWQAELHGKEIVVGWARGFDEAVEFISSNL